MVKHRPPAETLEIRELVTPEGAVLHLRLAKRGQRAAAFAIDFAIMLAALIALTLFAVALLSTQSSSSPAAIIWLLGFFLLRNFYFTLFESGGRAATFGKRLMKIRVVARDGSRLTGGAVVARNLMRELEVFLPFPLALMAWSHGMGNNLLRWMALFWTLIFLLFPLFNKDRLRVGDLLAGTWVVENERPKMMPEQLDVTGAAQTNNYDFTQAELETYGQLEVQKLAEILHRDDIDQMTEVAVLIRRKIGRPYAAPGPDGDRGFLQAYYTAARLQLERRLLFGQRKRDKFDALN